MRAGLTTSRRASNRGGCRDRCRLPWGPLRVPLSCLALRLALPHIFQFLEAFDMAREPEATIERVVALEKRVKAVEERLDG